MANYLIIELEAVLLEKNKRSADIVRITGHTPASVSKIRNGKVKAIRLRTLLDICTELDCQPGDLLKVVTDEQLDQLLEERAEAFAARNKAGIDRAVSPERVYVVDLSDEE